MKQKGFTVIEMMVVGAMGAVLLTIVLYVLTSSAKMASKARLNRIIDDQGAWLIFELRKNLMTARVDSITCTGTNTVTFNNRFNDGQTSIVCQDNKVASNSAHPADLTSSEVRVDCGNNFVSCDPPSVTFNFKLTAGVNSVRPEDYTCKSFSTVVTVRE